MIKNYLGSTSFIKKTFIVLATVAFLVGGFFVSTGIALAGSNPDATLSGLTISSGALSPEFSSNINSYAKSVDNSVTGITVNPTSKDTNATIIVNGKTVVSGSESDSIKLDEGDNTVSVVVIVPTLETIQQNYGNTSCAEENLWCNGADLNRDGIVDLADLTSFAANDGSSTLGIIRSNYGNAGCTEGDNSWCNGADLNKDGVVDLADLADLENFSTNSEQTNTYTIIVTRAPDLIPELAPVVSHGGGSGGGCAYGYNLQTGACNFAPVVAGQVLGASTSTTPTTGQVLGASTFQFTNFLRQGMSGDDVKQLQERLRGEGHFTFHASTGFFGSFTLQAVKEYQAAHGISPVTGFVGGLTIAELNK